MNQAECDKLLLAKAMGLRLIYCKDCNIVEFEIGAVSLRLCPDVVQRMANLLMKASLKLDRLVPESGEVNPSEVNSGESQRPAAIGLIH